ncbi:MAG TPA: type II toxin-antitoxin system VapC family toxin [Candidatus Baltobacteraceae bacterium]|nr:type II toxin-antitoxin system VapC family toxin [Candidatus Baltobacteraceae bacterium]
MRAPSRRGSSGEIRKGIALLGDRQRARKLDLWLTSVLPRQFGDRVLSFDLDVADRWGRLMAWSKRNRIMLSPIDSLIAATALQYNMSVVTRNERDFLDAGVAVTNPWVP